MIGGGGQVDIFYIKSDHSGLVKADGTTPVATVADRAIRIGKDYTKNNILTQTAFTPGDDGPLSVTWTQTKFDAAWDTFLKTVVSRVEGGASSETEELVDERGIKIGGAAATTAKEVLIVSYGAVDADGKIPVIFAIGSFARSSGAFSFEANKFAKPTLTFTSRGCQKAGGLAVTTALDIWVTGTNASGVLDAAQTATLGAGYYYDIAFLTPKA